MLKNYNILNLMVLILGISLIINGSILFFKINKSYLNFSKINIKSQIINKYNTINNIDKFSSASQVNNLYSEKIIENNDEFENNTFNKILVQIKPKPLNPSIVDQLNKEVALTNYNNKFTQYYKLEHLTDQKKNFIKTLLPLISYENQKILLKRKKLIDIKNILITKKTLNSEDIRYLNKIAKNYKLKSKNIHKLDLVEKLLVYVDIIPNSIVLAQAANESGWGTSRFAKEFNALFGEYTYDFSTGVVPLNREEGAKHFVKAFSSVEKSVESYFKNLNTHYAYNEFRKVREIMRSQNNFSQINLLVERLNKYAEDKNYIKTISSIIESNDLYKFDFINYNSFSL